MSDKGIANSRQERTLVGVPWQRIGMKSTEKTTAEITREVGVANSTSKKWVSKFEGDENLSCRTLPLSKVLNRDCGHS